MKKSFTFKGNKRAGESAEMYANYPLLVTSLYKLNKLTDYNSNSASFSRRNDNNTFAVSKGDYLIEGASDAQVKTLQEGPYNYFFGRVTHEVFTPLLKKEELDTFSDAPAKLPQNFHFFDVEMPAETLYFSSKPNYNFYVKKLEDLDNNTSHEVQRIVRPSDFYAYKSVKILSEKLKEKGKKLTPEDFAYKTAKQALTYVDPDNGKLGFNSIEVEKRSSFLKPYLMQGSYPATNYEEQQRSFLSKQTEIDGKLFPTNNTSFISQDKLLLDAVNNYEKVLPYNIVLESNYNMIFENAGNSEFKKILKDLNLYETFIYNLVDRHEKPFYSLSDDGETDFNKIQKDFSTKGEQQFAIRRAPMVSEILKAAFKGEGLISPVSNTKHQSDQLRSLTKGPAKHISEQLSDLDDKYDETATTAANKGSNGTGELDIGARTDFIYTDHNENTTVTDFDSFIFAARMEEFVNRHYVPLVDRLYNKDNNGNETNKKKQPSKNYVEVIAYSIERYRIAGSGNNISYQFEKEYIVPSSVDKDELIKIVDAGVNYDIEYVYRFYSHVLSLGTGVKDLGSKVDIKTKQLRADYLSYPDLRVMKIPLYETKSQYIIDSLPVYPSSIVVPSRQDPTKIKVVLSDNVSGLNDILIPIFTEDNKIIQKLISKKLHMSETLGAIKLLASLVTLLKRPETKEELIKLVKAEMAATDNKVIFQILESVFFDFDSKSPVTGYEILRLDIPPENYTDFKAAKVIKINKVNGVGFEDTVVPNSGYYYCFRAVNAHGYASNPSPVIQVRVDSDDQIHTAEVKPYVFPQGIATEPVIEPLLSNGVISISLSEFQAMPATPEKSIKTSADLLNKIKFLAEDPNKLEGINFTGNTYFKCRVRSRTTGREIDLNFYPKLVALDKVGDSGQSISLMKEKGFTGGDFIEVSNYFDLSVKDFKTLFKEEEEFSVSEGLIQKISDKIKNKKLDTQTLQSLMANYKKLKST